MNFVKTVYNELFHFFLSIDILIFEIGCESIGHPRMWLKVFKTLVNFRPTAPSRCQARINSREASAEINCYFAFWLPTIMHTVLKYPYFEFRFNLMNTPSFIGHFCNKVCPAMLALSWLCLPTFPAPCTSSNWKLCSDRLPALSGMVRVTCHTEISQTR